MIDVYEGIRQELILNQMDLGEVKPLILYSNLREDLRVMLLDKLECVTLRNIRLLSELEEMKYEQKNI